MDRFTFQEAVTVFFTACLPYLELRGAIPLAISMGASGRLALAVSLAGNLFPVIPLMLFLPVVARWADRFAWVNRVFRWVLAKVGKKREVIDRYGPLGLVVFAAVPLPMTGAWSAAVLAYLLRIKKRKALPAIVVGVLAAGLIVTILSKGVKALL
ncbi:MAG TPA: small multi-drug export protein [Bacillota bacterium]|nr:small multi-drug export protein [Bacillota bacterium]